MEWIYIAIAALSGAFFNLVFSLVMRFLSSGKVTPDHLKKEDLEKVEKAFKESFIKLEGAFNRHLDRHAESDNDFVLKEAFERHLHDCPIKEVVSDINQHRISHGIMETRMDDRLGVIEKFANETNDLLRLYAERLNELNTNLQIMIREVKGYHDNDSNHKDEMRGSQQ